jgi:hypothetical protein
MRMRTLGGTGIKVSPYCLGAMMFGAWGNSDHDESIRISPASRRTWRGLRPVGAAHIVEHGLALLIDKAGEQLLRVPEDQRPGKDLCGRVQRAETGDELATHEQQAEEGGDRAGRELEGGERNRQAVPLGRALDTADDRGGCYGRGGEPDEFDHDEVPRFGGLPDHIVDSSV